MARGALLDWGYTPPDPLPPPLAVSISLFKTRTTNTHNHKKQPHPLATPKIASERGQEAARPGRVGKGLRREEKK